MRLEKQNIKEWLYTVISRRPRYFKIILHIYLRVRVEDKEKEGRKKMSQEKKKEFMTQS